MAEDIGIEIFGQTFRVATGSAAPAYIKRLAEYVDARMRTLASTTKVMPLNRMAILTALNIADDLLKLQDDTERSSHLLSAKTDRLIALVQKQLTE